MHSCHKEYRNIWTTSVNAYRNSILNVKIKFKNKEQVTEREFLILYCHLHCKKTWFILNECIVLKCVSMQSYVLWIRARYVYGFFNVNI